MEENQKDIDPTLQYFADVRQDFKVTSKFLSITLVISLFINLVVVGLFLNVITAQNRDFMEFLNTTDFELIIEQHNFIENIPGSQNNIIGN